MQVRVLLQWRFLKNKLIRFESIVRRVLSFLEIKIYEKFLLNIGLLFYQFKI